MESYLVWVCIINVVACIIHQGWRLRWGGKRRSHSAAPFTSDDEYSLRKLCSCVLFPVGRLSEPQDAKTGMLRGVTELADRRCIHQYQLAQFSTTGSNLYILVRSCLELKKTMLFTSSPLKMRLIHQRRVWNETMLEELLWEELGRSSEKEPAQLLETSKPLERIQHNSSLVT